jgi:hypothetical protein
MDLHREQQQEVMEISSEEEMRLGRCVTCGKQCKNL